VGKTRGSCRESKYAGAQAAIDHSGARLKHTLRAAWLPAHLPELVHASVDQKVDRRFRSRARDRQALPVAATTIDHRTLIEFEIILKFFNELKKPSHFRVDRM
jgi:hypothetical protein